MLSSWLRQLDKFGVIYVITRDYEMLCIEDESKLYYALSLALGEAYIFTDKSIAEKHLYEIHEVLSSFVIDYEITRDDY